MEQTKKKKITTEIQKVGAVLSDLYFVVGEIEEEYKNKSPFYSQEEKIQKEVLISVKKIKNEIMKTLNYKDTFKIF